MNVLQKAENRLADLQAVELLLLRELGRARESKTKVVEFIEMYRGFDAPEPNPDGVTDVGQTVAAEEPSQSAEVTPAAVESVAAEEGPDTSSAQSQANAGAEATVREEVQPAPMAEVEPVSRLAAGRTADAEEAGSGLGASSAPIPPETANEHAHGKATDGLDPGQAANTGGEHETHGVAEIPNSTTEAAKPEWLSAAVIDDDHKAAGAGSGAGDSPDASVSVVEPGAPKIPVADQILALQAEHPEWTAKDFAEAIGITQEHVNAAAHKRGIVIARSKVRGPSTVDPSGLSLRQRIENDLADHPNSTAREIGDRPGIHQKHIASVARNGDLPVRKLSPEELIEARRRGGLMGGATIKARRGEPAEAREPPPAPTPPPEPELPPASTVPPPRPVNDDEIIPPEPRRVSRPRGKLFWLRDTDGKYLDRFCSSLVRDRKAAWVGTEAQLAGCRRNFAIARDLREQVVEKEGAKV